MILAQLLSSCWSHKSVPSSHMLLALNSLSGAFSAVQPRLLWTNLQLGQKHYSLAIERLCLDLDAGFLEALHDLCT
jgi:hypothetical protein